MKSALRRFATVSVTCLLIACGGKSSPPQASSSSGSTPGVVTVSWTIPAQNTDGSALSDLTGFQVLYGTSPGSLSNMLPVSGATTTSKDVTGLAAGTYYFAVATVNASGLVSSPSSPVQVTVR